MPVNYPTITWTPAVQATLERVNAEVNAFHYETDMEQFAKDDFWQRISVMKAGDCEDYAIEKMLRLREFFDWHCLLLATCWVEGPDGAGSGEYHAVLIVATTIADLCLDSRFQDIRKVSDLPYKFDEMMAPEGGKWIAVSSTPEAW